MLTSLSTKLENSIRGKLDETSDFLFYASSYYLHNLVDSGSRQWEGLGSSDREAYLEHSVVGPFISTLRKYLDKRGTPDQSVPGRMGLPDPSDKEEPFFGDFLNFLQNKRQDVKVEIITDKNSEPPLDEGDHIEDPPQIGNDASKLV
ncbi:hypothetical protein CVT26_009259 [Gymnopilus dilepis]|uniref:Uncharacterized protein n=1 Tax=Gymnopilus dilepis TaxID=231916 RepID=A0A409WUP2_9AGAR|nr:hypothetical protein CVT26_009259 [Gymnopilus dilepis]